MKTLSAPISISLSITNKCNLDCKHCFSARTRLNQDLPTEKIIDIIRQIIEMKIFQVAISGGEPLLQSDFFHIIEVLDKPWISLTLNTNGTLITKALAKKLSHTTIKGYTVSLDGSCAAIQDAQRSQGSFESSIKGIRNLLTYGCSVVISTTVTRFNYKDIKNIAFLGKSLGVDKVRFHEVVCTGNAACFHESVIMRPEEKFEALGAIDELKRMYGGFIIGSMVQLSNLMRKLRQRVTDEFPFIVPACGAATTRCSIRADGCVVPCGLIWDEPAGDLRKTTLYDIWHNSEVMKALRMPMLITQDMVPGCVGCRYLRLCYKGHRCSPYLPGQRLQRKELYCWNEAPLSST